MYAILGCALTTLIKRGTLRVTGPDGQIRDYGDGTGAPSTRSCHGSSRFWWIVEGSRKGIVDSGQKPHLITAIVRYLFTQVQ